MGRRGSSNGARSTHRLALVIALVSLIVGAGARADAADGDSPHRRERGKATSQRFRVRFEVRSLDGSGNNTRHPAWGRAGTPYLRFAPAAYEDGVAGMVSGPDPRFVSNRVFNDLGQNIFSSRGLSQWVWVWGQFLDHTFGLRQTQGGEEAPLPFDASDPLESFTNDFGQIAFERTPAAPGTGKDSPRQQINTVSSYIDAAAVYGNSEERLEWLRDGPANGDLADNAATLMLPRGYLPLATARGDASSAPSMELQGRLAARPDAAVIAGDVRANENLALTAVHTLFAREHNRIVAMLPDGLSDQLKFEIARRVVGAEQQHITYNEFLPAVGVRLPPYRGYDPTVDASLSNEFAAVAYRMHSMVHGEFEIDVEAGTYSAAELDAFKATGIEVNAGDGEVQLIVPLHVTFGNPALVEQLGLGPVLAGLGAERQYANDEQIDNQLRSVLFEVPRPAAMGAAGCSGEEAQPSCFSGVVDLAAIDIQRGRDHGIPAYNDLREAFGLPAVESFAALTGEDTEQFPHDAELDRAVPLDDPDILAAVSLFDRDGNPVPPGTDAASEDVVDVPRRTTLAARLRAIYGSVDRLDSFVGMVAEPHVRGSELGELQLAIWTDQFERLRDGDRFFYANDPFLKYFEYRYGVSARHTLAEVIAANTDADELSDDVFSVANGTASNQANAQPNECNKRRGNEQPTADWSSGVEGGGLFPLAGERALGGSGVELDGAPAVPGDHRPVGAMRIAERFELACSRSGHVPRQPVTAPNSEVAGRPDVEAAELEHEKHLGGPWADPPDGRQPGDDLDVGLMGESAGRKHDGAVQHLGRQVP
jgi:peroxidase